MNNAINAKRNIKISISVSDIPKKILNGDGSALNVDVKIREL